MIVPPRGTTGAAGPGRGGTVAAVRAMLSSPSAWTVGAAGFLARGGLLVLALPILSLPTPVGVTLLVPPLGVTTSGLSPAFASELLAAGGAIVVYLLVALLVAALGEDASYRRVVDGAARRSTAVTVARLVGVEVLALLPAIVAAVVATARLVAVGEREYLLPSSTSVPFVVRVVQEAAASVIAVGLALVLADLLNALGSRAVLRRAYPSNGSASADPGADGPATTIADPGADGPATTIADPGADGSATTGPDAMDPGATGRGTAITGTPAVDGRRTGPTRWPVAVARIVATWLATWLVTLASLAPGLLAVVLAWPLARDAYTATMSRTPPGWPQLAGATVTLVAAWLAAILLAGAGSSIRALLWTRALLGTRYQAP